MDNISTKESPKLKNKDRVFFILRLGITIILFIYIFGWLIEYRDHLELSNGEKLTGKILKQTDAGVYFKDRRGNESFVDYKDLKKTNGKLSGLEPGFFTVITEIDILIFIISISFFFITNSISAFRWHMLLTSQDFKLSQAKAFRITFIGVFFNNFLLGIIGGDIVKAYFIARDTEAKAKAVISVVFDRIIGVFGLVLLAGTILLFKLTKPEFLLSAFIIYGTLLGIIFFGGIMLYFPPKTKGKINLLDKVRTAFALYRNHKKVIAISILLSLIIHILSCSAIYGFGIALGIKIQWLIYVVYSAVTFILTALPISIAGWGLGEYLYASLFTQVGVSPAQAVVLSILLKIAYLCWGLLGGIFYMFGEKKSAPISYNNEKEQKDFPKNTSEGESNEKA